MLMDWSFNIGELIQTLVIIGGGMIVLGSMRATMTDIEKDLRGLQDDVKSINKVIAQIAVQNSRLDRVEEDIRDLRHGRGFVMTTNHHPDQEG